MPKYKFKVEACYVYEFVVEAPSEEAALLEANEEFISVDKELVDHYKNLLYIKKVDEE